MIPDPAIPAARCAAECIASARRRCELGLEAQPRLQGLGTWAGAGKCSGLVHAPPSCPGKCSGPDSAMAVKLLGCTWALPIHHRTRARFILALTAAQQALCWDLVHKESGWMCMEDWSLSGLQRAMGPFVWQHFAWEAMGEDVQPGTSKACYQCGSMRSSRADLRHTTRALAFASTTCSNQPC